MKDAPAPIWPRPFITESTPQIYSRESVHSLLISTVGDDPTAKRPPFPHGPEQGGTLPAAAAPWPERADPVLRGPILQPEWCYAYHTRMWICGREADRQLQHGIPRPQPRADSQRRDDSGIEFAMAWWLASSWKTKASFGSNPRSPRCFATVNLLIPWAPSWRRLTFLRACGDGGYGACARMWAQVDEMRGSLRSSFMAQGAAAPTGYHPSITATGTTNLFDRCGRIARGKERNPRKQLMCSVPI
jgi:hypothetical protein